MDEPIGQQLGNYQIVKFLGKGGFAKVYLGEHGDTRAAIKLLEKRLVKDKEAVFQQEARTLAQLIHPNIVRLLDFGIEADSNMPYLVMDYAPDGTLRDRHSKNTPLPLPMVIAYVKQIAAALQYVHDQQLIHCDVKPGNILLGRNGELLLSDFGIARWSQTGDASEHSAYHAAGTAYYMAPEQILGKPERASDQYALAIMVYEWLCGQLPFSEGNADAIQRQHLHAPVPPLHEQLPTIFLTVEQVVLQALAKRPQERFDSVHAFATALEQASLDTTAHPAQFLSSTPVITRAPAPEQNEALTRRGLSRRAVLFGTGAAVGLALLGTGIWWERGRTSLPPHGTLYLTYRGHASEVLAMAWSPDGKHIASGSDDVQVWNAVNGGDAFTYRGHAYLINTVSWSPNGQRIASASQDGTVQVWDAVNGDHVFIYHGNSGSAAWSPTGQRIASASFDRAVQVWDAAGGGHIFTYNDGSSPVAWSPDGQRIASGGNGTTVQVWDAANGGHIFTYRGHANEVLALAWSPDGQHIASASFDKTVQVWSTSNGGNAFTYRGHSNRVTAVAWSPDSQRVASASFDATVQVWQAV